MLKNNKSVEEMRALIDEVLFQKIDRSSHINHSFMVNRQSIQEQFPELVHLNEVKEGSPIFWFHSVGGVQPYSVIAKQTTRPFYGIETRGFRTKREPLQGVHAMAAYYVHIIKSVQLNGPYELGGYSLGGLIAYEVTRQLQELGDMVKSIVMLDTLAPIVMPLTKNIPYKSRLLQGTNFILATKIIQDTNKLKQLLIHQDEIDWKNSDEKILEDLSILAKQKGAFPSIEELKENIVNNAKIQVNYEYERYISYLLNEPDDVNCYYFRNQSGLFFGELEPFYTTPGENILVDNIDYWSDWYKYLPKIEIIDVNSANHMTFFNEKGVYEQICKFCQRLYSGGN